MIAVVSEKSTEVKTGAEGHVLSILALWTSVLIPCCALHLPLVKQVALETFRSGLMCLDLLSIYVLESVLGYDSTLRYLLRIDDELLTSSGSLRRLTHLFPSLDAACTPSRRICRSQISYLRSSTRLHVRCLGSLNAGPLLSSGGFSFGVGLK